MLHLFLYGYLGIGFVFASTVLYALRNVPASVFVIIRDGLNVTLFWPYIAQMQYASYKKMVSQYKDAAKYREEYKKDPEAFKQNTSDALKKLMDLLEKKNDKDKTNWN